MNHQTRSFGISLVVHALFIAFLLGFSSSAVWTQKPIVIDFTVREPARQRTDPGQGPAEGEAKSAQPVRKAGADREPVHQEKEIPAAPLPAPSVPDTQAPVPVALTAPGPAAAGPAGAGVVSKAVEESSLPGKRDGGSGAYGPAGSRTATAGSETARYLREHFSYIRDLVQKNVSYPGMARKMGWEGKVVIAFTVLSDGHVRDVKITEGCGRDILDKNAVEAVKKAVPFPKPPVAAQVVIPILYRLN